MTPPELAARLRAVGRDICLEYPGSAGTMENAALVLERMSAALAQISRMRLTPDRATNLTTLRAAINIASQALGDVQ